MRESFEDNPLPGSMDHTVFSRLPEAVFVDTCWDIVNYCYNGHILSLSVFDCEGNSGTGASAWNADIDKFLARIKESE